MKLSKYIHRKLASYRKKRETYLKYKGENRVRNILTLPITVSIPHFTLLSLFLSFEMSVIRKK